MQELQSVPFNLNFTRKIFSSEMFSSFASKETSNFLVGKTFRNKVSCLQPGLHQGLKNCAYKSSPLKHSGQRNQDRQTTTPSVVQYSPQIIS